MTSTLLRSFSRKFLTKSFPKVSIKDSIGIFKKSISTSKQVNLGTIEVQADLANIDNGSLDTPKLIQKYGYTSEVYNITTRDGYKLQLHRIPKPGGEPFLLQHGLVDSSAGFVFSGGTRALSFYLSDLGFDVWLGNTRGNRYAKEHLYYDPVNDTEFWDFHLTEIANYDLSATIDYVLGLTKNENLHYVGHNTGNTIFWILCSLHPEYNDKIKLMHALAPLVYLENVSEILKNFLKDYARDPITYTILPPSQSTTGILSLDENFARVCLDYLFAICGPNKRQLIPQMLPTIFGHIPAGCSSQQLKHLMQIADSGIFSGFDFGTEGNTEKYGKDKPPSFDLKKVLCPTLLYYSEYDQLATPNDVERLRNELGNCQGKYIVKSESWTHYDFMFGKDSRELVYKLLVENSINFDKGIFRGIFE